MYRLIFTLIIPFYTANLINSQDILTAKDSEPDQMGWMMGFPPPEEKIISASDGSFFKFPALRYSVCHMRQFMPTTRVMAAQSKRYRFKVKLDKGIDTVTFFPLKSDQAMTWESSLSKNYTDGILILHKGKIVYEKYFGELQPNGLHAAMSVSKTLTGTLAAREILDMTTALKYSEDYSDPKAEIWSFSAAGNPFPKPDSYKGPELFSERIWEPLGTHFDGYYQIDGAGIAFAGGGFSANMIDMAMIGEMIRKKGYFNKRQILPESLIEDLMKGGSQEAFNLSVYGASLKDWSYRNMWWITHNEHGAFAARGVHGQTIYIDPKGEMVLVRFASHPEAKNSKIDPTSLPAYHAVAKYLLNK